MAYADVLCTFVALTAPRASAGGSAGAETTALLLHALPDGTPMPPPPVLPTGSDAQNGHLRGLILQKEKELHDINEYRIHTLENLVGDKEKDITEHKQDRKSVV